MSKKVTKFTKLKDTFYFQHDYEPTSDPKIQALIKEYEWCGYGLYWRIVEMLHSDPNHKLPKKRFIFISLSNEKTTAAAVEKLIDSCITDFELFESDGDLFWSKRVIRNIESREEKRLAKVESGRKGGLNSAKARVKQSEAELKHTSSNGEAVLEQNQPKERKGKEIKEKEKNIYTSADDFENAQSDNWDEWTAQCKNGTSQMFESLCMEEQRKNKNFKWNDEWIDAHRVKADRENWQLDSQKKFFDSMIGFLRTCNVNHKKVEGKSKIPMFDSLK